MITAGVPRKPGMSRDDLRQHERRRSSPTSTAKVVAHSPDAILIVVSNPLDAMCHVAMKATPAARASA